MTVHDNLWTLKFDNFSEFQNVISDNPPPRPLPPNVIITHCVRKQICDSPPLPIFNSSLFNRIKIVPIYAHESSKPISLIKRRFEYLTKALLARFSKIIMFFKFLLEKVSRRFENDYIHEIEYSWSVNIDNTGSILAVYCV